MLGFWGHGDISPADAQAATAADAVATTLAEALADIEGRLTVPAPLIAAEAGESAQGAAA
jgi:hypothetical protein